MNKVLLVDDSATMRKLIRRVLRQTQIPIETILEAADGVEAMERMASDPDIDMVLTDVNMPNMNGIDLVKNLRETHAPERLPIIMITTESGERMRKRAIQAGANGYVTKPFTADAITTALERYAA